MVWPGCGNTTGDHVGVADRLDFLQATLFGESVKCGKYLVQKVNDLMRADVRGQRREAHQVGKENRGFRVFVDNVDFTVLHASSDGSGKNAEQKPLGFVLF